MGTGARSADADNTILAKLDELIAATRAGSVPFRDRWGDAHDVGTILGRPARYVVERIACLPSFPKPMPGGHPRWLLGEVQDWAHEYRRHYEKTGKLPGANARD